MFAWVYIKKSELGLTLCLFGNLVYSVVWAETHGVMACEFAFFKLPFIHIASLRLIFGPLVLSSGSGVI